MGVGDSLARWVYNNQPVKFAAIELVPETSSDVPEILFGHLNSDGTGERRHPDPRARLVPVRPERPGTATVVQGLDDVPADDRPTIREVNIVHLAWDVMVGLGTLLFLLSLWYWASLDLPARHAAEPVVPARSPPAPGCSPWSPWRRAGSSARSAASPGSSTST